MTKSNLFNEVYYSSIDPQDSVHSDEKMRIWFSSNGID